MARWGGMELQPTGKTCAPAVAMSLRRGQAAVAIISGQAGPLGPLPGIKRILLYKPLSQPTVSDWHYKWHRYKKNSPAKQTLHHTLVANLGM